HPFHAGTNFGVGRVWIPIEQRPGRQDLAALAIAALGHLLVDPGLLQGIELAVPREAFERRDLTADRRGGSHARAGRYTIHQHGADAALAEPAAEPRSLEVEIVAQHIK